jgi:hypothetical protein
MAEMDKDFLVRRVLVVERQIQVAVAVAVRMLPVGVTDQAPAVAQV